MGDARSGPQPPGEPQSISDFGFSDLPAGRQVSDSARRPAWRQAAVGTAVVSGALAAVVAAALASNALALRRTDFLDPPGMQALRARLAANPADEALKEEIRRLDRDLRAAYHRRQQRAQIGGVLLAALALVLLVSLHAAARLGRPLAVPAGTPEPAQRTARFGRWAVAGAGALLAAGALWAAWLAPGGPARPLVLAAGQAQGTQEPIGQPELPPPASRAQLARAWPRFRGLGGSGHWPEADLPLDWDVKTRRNVLWVADVPLPGMGSPIAWAHRVYLTGAVRNRHEVFCFDTADGKLLWRTRIQPRGSAPEPDAWDQTGLAAPTPCTDGRAVYALFANGDLAAVGFDGEPLWSTALGVPQNPYGHATSLLSYGGRLLVQMDQAPPGASALLAFDGATGERLWRRPRPVRGSWATPIIAATQRGDQLITLGDPWVIAYDPPEGRELWRAKCMGPDVAPSPVFGAHLVFAVAEAAELCAIRPTGSGDVTGTDKIVWTADADLPNIVSPLYAPATGRAPQGGQRLYTLTTDSPVLVCYDAATGKDLWFQPYDGLNFDSSPTLVGGRILLLARDGTAIVLAPDDRYKELSRSSLGEGCHASPAFLPGRMFLRGQKHLFCIGKTPRPAAASDRAP